MIRFSSLGSGSEGNALLVESGASRLLLDCGFSVAETVRRLERLGIPPESLDAILVTHEHDDHVGGVARFARRFGTTVYLSYGTYTAAATQDKFADVVIIDAKDGADAIARNAHPLAIFKRGKRTVTRERAVLHKP